MNYGGTGAMGFLRLARLAKATTLMAVVYTACCMLALLGWEALTFVTAGTLPALPLSTVMEILGMGQGTIYVPASDDETVQRSATLISSISNLPAAVLLLIALASLIAFYLWLARIERRYTKGA
jgi:hypothetical protein